MSEVISFSDLIRKGTVKVKDTDNTKTVSIKDLLNKPIIINRYKLNQTTKYGSGKLIVYFKYPEDKETPYKFYTGSSVLQDLITQIPEDILSNNGVLVTVTKFTRWNY